MSESKPTGHDLDAAIAKALGWTLVSVGPDAFGENACEILTPDGKLGVGELPPLGKIHEAWLVPQWHRDLPAAIRLAREHGIDSLSLHHPVDLMPTVLAWQVLEILQAEKN